MMKTSTKRGRGRSPIGDEAMLEPVTIRLPREMVARINAIRSQRLDRPDKSTVVRELIAKGLLAA